jgi:hypothetical protein
LLSLKLFIVENGFMNPDYSALYELFDDQLLKITGFLLLTSPGLVLGY